MAYSYVEYTGNGTNRAWSVPFGYIKKQHVYVTVDDVVVSFSWTGDASIETTLAAGENSKVIVKRETPKDPLVTFHNGGVIKAKDLNTATLQALYLSQEAKESAIQILTSTTNLDSIVVDTQTVAVVIDTDNATVVYSEQE